jgi:hypothetical protein
VAAVIALGACSASPRDYLDSAATEEYQTNPEFSHPARYLFREFDRASDADLAFVVRSLEASVESTVDWGSEELIDRSPAVDLLQGDDTEGLEHPDADPAECLAVSLAARSDHAIGRHVTAALQTDQTPGDPSAPDHHVRVFLEGTELCFADRSCAVLEVQDELTRSNPLFNITLTDRVDYRWLDLGLPDPTAVLLGADSVNEGEPRWAIVSHSWLPERAADGNAAFEQAYSLGLWIPADASATAAVLRYSASWTQTELGFTLDDTTMRQLARGAIQDAYDAQETWLETLP